MSRRARQAAKRARHGALRHPQPVNMLPSPLRLLHLFTTSPCPRAAGARGVHVLGRGPGVRQGSEGQAGRAPAGEPWPFGRSTGGRARTCTTASPCAAATLAATKAAMGYGSIFCCYDSFKLKRSRVTPLNPPLHKLPRSLSLRCGRCPPLALCYPSDLNSVHPHHTGRSPCDAGARDWCSQGAQKGPSG